MDKKILTSLGMKINMRN